MRTNDAFTDDSLTMVVDIETNQWYLAQNFLTASDEAIEEEAYKYCTARTTNANLLMFILTVCKVLKCENPSIVNRYKCFSMENIKNAFDLAKQFSDDAEQELKRNELETFNFLTRTETGFKLTSAETETNLAGFFVLRTAKWLDMDNETLKMHLASLPQFTKAGLDEGYYALVDKTEIDLQFKKFIKYHRPKRGHRQNLVAGQGLIVAHNISYEWNNCVRHLPAFVELHKKGELSAPLKGSAKNTIKSCDIMYGKKPDSGFDSRPVYVAMRDTFMYTRASLAKAGKKYEFPKGDISYYKAFNLDEVKHAAKRMNEDSDEVALIKYNRRDCEIPFLILHETMGEDYDAIFVSTQGQKGKTIEPKIPVSNNQLADMRFKIQTANIYENVTGYRDSKGRDVPKGTKGAHRVIEFQSVKTDKKQVNIRETMKLHNKKNFGYSLKSETIHDLFGEPDLMINYDIEKQKTEKQVAGGGLVGINPFFAFKKVKQVGLDVVVEGKVYKNSEIFHCDLISAHPSQVNKRYFPAHDAVPATDAEKEKALDCLKRMDWTSKAQNPHKAFATIVNYRPHGFKYYSGFAKFTLKNVKLRGQNSNAVPAMPDAKATSQYSGVRDRDYILNTVASCFDAFEQSKIDAIKQSTKKFSHRNKVYWADEMEVACTFEDLCIYQMFYDFEITDAKDMHIYRMQAVEGYVWYIFMLYGRRKQIYKEIEKMVGKYKDGRASKQDVQDLLDKYTADIEPSDHAYLSAHSDDVRYAHEQLQKVKGIFNGIYGQLYQSPIHEQIELVLDCKSLTENVIDKESFRPSMHRNYLTGMYIAQWSRIDLALHLKYCIDNGCTVLYWATDSIYFVGPKGFNVKSLFNEQEQVLKDQRPNVNSLGGMDMEQYENGSSLITGLCTSQCLRIVIGRIAEEVDDNGNKTGKKYEAYDATLSGAPADVVFDGCKTFDDYADRLCEEDYYISPFDNNKNEKKHNEDGTFNLLPQGFVLNDSNSNDVIFTRFISACGERLLAQTTT